MAKAIAKVIVVLFIVATLATVAANTDKKAYVFFLGGMSVFLSTIIIN